MSTVEFRNIVKKYGALTVLDNLSLHVGDGEFLVLLGPSGCGKTTLLNLLAGLLETNAGEIWVDGQEVSDLDPKDRGLAMVFQSVRPLSDQDGAREFALRLERTKALA